MRTDIFGRDTGYNLFVKAKHQAYWFNSPYGYVIQIYYNDQLAGRSPKGSDAIGLLTFDFWVKDSNQCSILSRCTSPARLQDFGLKFFPDLHPSHPTRMRQMRINFLLSYKGRCAGSFRLFDSRLQKRVHSSWWPSDAHLPRCWMSRPFPAI